MVLTLHHQVGERNEAERASKGQQQNVPGPEMPRWQKTVGEKQRQEQLCALPSLPQIGPAFAKVPPALHLKDSR